MLNKYNGFCIVNHTYLTAKYLHDKYDKSVLILDYDVHHGDGTQSFYNFIYYVFAGFTENDTLRSFLIREKKMKRIEALEMIKKENYPRFPTLEWYCSLFDLKISEVIQSILKHAKKYNGINCNHYRIL
jgi:acetoin utilization deacetylase AcuC-like enzyme